MNIKRISYLVILIIAIISTGCTKAFEKFYRFEIPPECSLMDIAPSEEWIVLNCTYGVNPYNGDMKLINTITQKTYSINNLIGLNDVIFNTAFSFDSKYISVNDRACSFIYILQTEDPVSQKLLYTNDSVYDCGQIHWSPKRDQFFITYLTPSAALTVIDNKGNSKQYSFDERILYAAGAEESMMPFWSFDGDKIFYIVEVETKDELMYLDLESGNSKIVFSDDSMYRIKNNTEDNIITYLKYNDIYRLDLDSSLVNKIDVCSNVEYEIGNYNYSTDGTWLVIRHTGDMGFYIMNKGCEKSYYYPLSTNISFVKWSLDKDTILVQIENDDYHETLTYLNFNQ